MIKFPINLLPNLPIKDIILQENLLSPLSQSMNLCDIFCNLTQKSIKALAYSASPKYNKSIPDTSPGYGIYFIYLDLFELSLPAKFFTDTISLTLFH